MKFKTFFLQRILAWALTILIGVTFIFFIPRMFPSDPVENMIAQMQSRSGNMDPAEMEALRQQLRIQFGLDGTLLEQYGYFLLHGLLQFDFGPSLMSYPEPVTSIIGRNLPYTLGLSLTTTLLAWIIGNFIGLLAGFRKNKTSSKILEGIAICIYPIPYFLVALVLQIVFAFVLGWFPIQTTLLTRGTFAQWLASESVCSAGHLHASARYRLVDYLYEVPCRHDCRRRLRFICTLPRHFRSEDRCELRFP